MNIELSLGQAVIISTYLFINLIAFIYMGADKLRALKHRRRSPEAHLLFLAIMFCAPGVLSGMVVFRHKIRKIYFSIGIPVALIENLGTLYFLYFYLLK